jgi:hypothetical protein
MKQLSIIITKDKQPYIEQACRCNLMKITNIKQREEESFCEIFIEYDPALLELIFTELFYAGTFYGLDKKII